MGKIKDLAIDVLNSHEITHSSELVKGDVILYYEFTNHLWQKAVITSIDRYSCDVLSIAGSIKGFNWIIGISELYDPQKYLLYNG